MGVTQLISPFYRQLDPKTFRSQFESGQIAWIPTSFAADIPQIMEVQRESPDDHFASKFQIRNMKETDFRSKTKAPDKAAKSSGDRRTRGSPFEAEAVHRSQGWANFVFRSHEGFETGWQRASRKGGSCGDP